MAVEAQPALADHLIGLVDVVQALKLKLGIQLRQVTLCCAFAQLQANLRSHHVLCTITVSDTRMSLISC